MNNLIFGIITIVLCAAGYYLSWRYMIREKYNIALVLLMVCGLALRIYTATDFYLHTWDERYHALVAKNLVEHPLKPTLYDDPVLPYDYKNWPANHVWLHKQPLPLWTMAASMWLFGFNEIALRLPSIILTTIGIFLSFFVGRYLFNKKTGYLTAFLYSINGLIIELTGGRVATDHVDIFFLFFIELAIVFSILFSRKKKTIYNVLAGACIGAAVLSKWLPALIVLPVWLLIVYDSGNFKLKTIVLQFIILSVTCIMIFLPWQLYIHNTFPLEAGWESSYNIKHLTEGLEGRTGPVYYFLKIIRINYGELIYLPLLWFLWKSLNNIRDLKRLAVTTWFLIPFLFFSLAKTKMQGYLLFTSPALFLMISEFYFMLGNHKINHKPKWLFNLIMLLLIALPLRYTIERVKPFEIRERNPQWANALKNLDTRNIRNGILFNYDRPIEAMFYTDLIVYPDIPDKVTINELLEKGHTIIINDNENVPGFLKEIKGVTIENINAIANFHSKPENASHSSN